MVKVKLVLDENVVVMFIVSFFVFLCMGEEYKLVFCFYISVYFICVKIVDVLGKSFGDDFSLCELCDGDLIVSWVDGNYEIFIEGEFVLEIVNIMIKY